MAEGIQDSTTSEDELPDLPVETAPAEEKPRQRLTDKLHDVPAFDEAAKDAYARRVVTDYEGSIGDRQEWQEQLDQGYQRYLNVTQEKNFPWPNAANFHPPVTMTDVETLKPRLIEAIVGQDPTVLVLPVGAEDTERAFKTEQFLNWQIQTELRLFDLVDNSAHLFLVAGVVIAKVRWKRDIRRVRAIRRFPAGTPIDIIFEHLFGRAVPEDLTHEKDFTWTGTLRLPGGRRTDVTAEFAFFEDEVQVLIDRDELTFESAKIEFPDPEDIIAPYRAGGDIQELPWITHRLYMGETELRRRARTGQFDAEAVEEIIALGPSGEDALNDTSGGAQQTLDRQEGVDPFAANARDDQWCILEDYREADIDEDGWPEQIVCWVSERHKKLLGWDYLDNVNASGKRPFVKAVFMPLPNRFYGISLPEMIRDIQDETTVIHNQRVDYGTLTNLPFGLRRASSMHKASLDSIRPGEFIDVDNPQTDIVFPQLRNSTSFGFQEEALLNQYNEKLTGVTDLALGRQPNRVGATRTATGVASLLSESGLRFKIFMVRFQEFWRQVFEHVLALDQQYLPPGKEFRVTGEPEVIRLQDREAIAGKYDLRLAATTETLNKQSMRESAQIKLSTLLNPGLIQLGVIGPENIYNLALDFLKSFDERDPSRLITKPQAVAPKDPAVEHAIFASGQDVEPSPAENTDAHLAAHDAFTRMPGYGWLTPEAKQKFQAHVAKTVQLKQMLTIAQQMGPGGGSRGAMGPGGVQAKNAQTGRAQPQTAGQSAAVQPAGASAMNGGAPMNGPNA